MSTSQSFWTKKRQELQSQGKLPPPQPSRLIPWWQDPDYTKPDRQLPEQQTQPEDSNHDFSRAEHLKSKSGNCPNCNSSNYAQGPDTRTVTRCFDCGYTGGRRVNDLDTMNIMSSGSARTLNVRQSASAEGIRMGTSSAEINAANYKLALSEQGKSYIDS